MNVDRLNRFIWKTAHHLIVHESFFLVNNDEGTLTLRKSEGFFTTFLWLIPGDRLTTKKINRELDESLTWMGAYRRKTPSIIQRSIHLYLFTEEKEKSYLELIPKLRANTIDFRYQSQAWAIDLTSGTIYTPKVFWPTSRKTIREIKEVLEQFLPALHTTEQNLAAEIIQWQKEINRHQNRMLSAYRKKILFRRGAPVTFTIGAINLMIWFLMTLMGGSTNHDVLIQFGAKYNPAIVEGEYWRLITPIFLHIGGYHLFFNSTALLSLGGHVERIFGSMRFLLIYLLSGITGNLFSFLFSPAISAGASGAIFGLFGALLYFATKNAKVFGHTMGPGLISGLSVNLLLGFIIPGIDNFAHLGGLVGGFLFSFLIRLPKQKQIKNA